MHDFYQEYVSSGQAGPRPESLHERLGPVRPYLDRMIRSELAGLSEPTIVDAACGSGSLVSILREHGFSKVTGVDLSGEQIALGQGWGIQGLIRADAISFLENVRGESVDVVFAMDFLEHLDIDTALRFLAVVRRSLAPAGKLILHVPNGQSPFCDAIRYADITHTRAFTRQSLNQLLFPSGMQVARVVEDRPPVHGVFSLFRRLIWTMWRSALSFVWAAEMGETPDALSRNILVVVHPLATARRI